MIALLKMKGNVAVDIRQAIGEILRRVAEKYLCSINRKAFLDYLTPTDKLGGGACCGIESVIHVIRLEIECANSDFVLFQVNFKNTFNNISCRLFLNIVNRLSRNLQPYTSAMEVFLTYNGLTFL